MFSLARKAIPYLLVVGAADCLPKFIWLRLIPLTSRLIKSKKIGFVRRAIIPLSEAIVDIFKNIYFEENMRTAVCFTFLVVKLYGRYNNCKYVKKKDGKDKITGIRSLEKLETKFMKVNLNMQYINTSKKEQILSTFAKVNVLEKNCYYYH